MIVHETRLPADDSHELSYIFAIFERKQQNLKKKSTTANYRWCFMA